MKNKTKIIGLGETVFDIIFRDNQPQKAVPGGSAFNAVISLGRCCVPCNMVTEVGDDRVGDIVTQFLKDNNVNTEFVYRSAGSQSHISLAFLNERNDAEYQFYKMHDALSMPPVTPDINAGDIVLFGSYFAINPKVRECVSGVLRQAHDAGAIIYYDVNFRSSHVKDLPVVMPSIIENMRMSTVVRGSREDFSLLFQCDDPEEVYKKHVGELCKTFIYTDADQPVQVFTPDYHVSYPAKSIVTVSTIGAGDNFNAGFCYAVHGAGLRGADDFVGLSEDVMGKFVSMGQRFSSQVCQTMDNYVPYNFMKE